MSQTSLAIVCIIFAFLVFVTMRGELPAYFSVFA